MLQSSLLLLIIFSIETTAYGFGSMGTISAAFGQKGFFCAIDAGGKQDVVCWTKNTTLSAAAPPLPGVSAAHSTSSSYFTDVQPMAALSGGEGFLCGILANSSQAFCWRLIDAAGGVDLVPPMFKNTAYSHIAAGKDHVCAVRGFYYADHDSGAVDCWDIVEGRNDSLSSMESSVFYDQGISNLVFEKVVSGEGFSCGNVREGGVACWGPKSGTLGISRISENYTVLASGRDRFCGISEGTNEVKCWGSSNDSFWNPPAGAKFVSLSAGASHFCGVREDNHVVQCWGSFNSSTIPKGGSGFLAIASSDFTTCGIREDELVIDCWSANGTSPPEYNPPLELCSPGLCSPRSCGEREFAFNVSSLDEQDLTSVCVRKDLKICSPCGWNCSVGFFLSSPCTENSDRVCTACSLCQNSSCWGICGMKSSDGKEWLHFRRLLIIIGSSASCCLLILTFWCVLSRLITSRKEEGTKKQFKSCMGQAEMEIDVASDSYPPLSTTAFCPGMAQIFRLSELKDATNGFKEFNELGRGSYGFVYKAVLPDGRQVAIKRANAATIIHTNTRDFDLELEILCNVRHYNIVNLLGYCSEMGERLLVYEYMPHGTLCDHLHGGLSPLNWSLRLRIAMQAAKGLEYLHKEADPPIVHRDVKSSNILLDSEWGARIADFGLLSPNEKDLGGDMKSDVYSFGVVLLEILSGRKAYDVDNNPPSIVDWGVPLIKQNKAAATIDRYVALPRNFEPLLKFADVAELTLREDPNQRPTMSEVASWLEQIWKDALS